MMSSPQRTSVQKAASCASPPCPCELLLLFPPTLFPPWKACQRYLPSPTSPAPPHNNLSLCCCRSGPVLMNQAHSYYCAQNALISHHRSSSGWLPAPPSSARPHLPESSLPQYKIGIIENPFLLLYLQRSRAVYLLVVNKVSVLAQRSTKANRPLPGKA